MSINSRRKGAVAERKFRDQLREHGFHGEGDDATIRGCQNAGRGKGGTVAPDVICPLLGKFHFEVKHREKGSVRDAYGQATRDAVEGQTPVYAFKRNHSPWLVCMSLEDFFDILRNTDTEYIRG